MSAVAEQTARDLLTAAEAEFSARRFSDAIGKFNAVARMRNAHESTAVWYVTRCYLSLGRLEKAGEALHRLEALEPNKGRVLATRAAYHLAMEELDRAEAYAKKALETDPSRTYPLYILAAAHFKSGKLQKSLDYLSIVPLTQEDDFGNLKLGIETLRYNILDTLKRRRDANHSLLILLRISPNNLEFLRAKANSLLRDGYPDEAIATVERMHEIAPQDESTLETAVYAYRDAGKTEQAIEFAKQLAEAKPTEVGPLISLIKLYRLHGYSDKVFATLDRAERLAPGDAGLQAEHAYSLMIVPERLNFQKARTIAEKLPVEGPNAEWYRIVLGMALLATGEEAEGWKYIDDVASSPDTPRESRTLAVTLQRHRRIQSILNKQMSFEQLRE
ncbi:MAG: hypothetical protein Fues2KO_41710 [Fuerstiella sp.]